MIQLRSPERLWLIQGRERVCQKEYHHWIGSWINCRVWSYFQRNHFLKCNQLRKKAYYQNSNIVVVHVSRPVCNYRHRKRCFGNFLNAVSQQPDNSIKCNVALLGFLFRLLPILNYVIKWWKSQALLETRYAAILYGAFLVSKFKTSHQTYYFSIQIFNPVIITWSSFIQI